MSHVDEGLIHAWIDGAFEPGDAEGAAIEAHLEACAECRATVEAALRLKERAADVLGRTAPDAVRVEPFERIVNARRARQAGAAALDPQVGAGVAGSRIGGDAGASEVMPVASETSAADGTRRRWPNIPLAWAASIMVAVTAGWFANTMLRPDRTDRGSAPFESARMVAPGTPPESSEGDRAVEASTEAAVDAASTGALGAAPLTQQRGQPDQAAAGESRRERAAADPGAAVAAPPPAALKAAGAILADSLATLVAEAERQLETRTESAAPDLLESAALEDWSDVTMAEAATRFGRVPFAIEGIPIESVQIRDAAGVAMLRVRQRVAPDAHVEIVQQAVSLSLDEIVVTGARDDSLQRAVVGRALADAANLAARRVADRDVLALPLLAVGDTPAVRVQQIGYTVVLRGPLPADSLRVLASRVR